MDVTLASLHTTPYWDVKETGTNVLKEPACTVEIVTPLELLLVLGTELSTV